MFITGVAIVLGAAWGWALPLVLRFLAINRSVKAEVLFLWIIMGALFSGGLVMTWQGRALHLFFLWVALGALTLQGAMDWLEGVVDDGVTAALFAVALVVRLLGWGGSWSDALLATSVMAVPSVSLAWRRCLGWGDVALLAVLAFLLGLREVMALMFFAFVPAGVVAALWLLSGRASRKDQWPLVPWLVLGFWLTLVLSFRPW